MTASRRRVDPDAAGYFARIVAAGSTISAGNQAAVNAFVVGCKADGIWAAIKASCLLAGPDDLTGALVPLVGAAPTNFNFVAGDYSRTTGLVGNGSTKYLDSNRNNNADPQDNQHLAVWVTTIETVPSNLINGGNNGSGASGLSSTGTRSRNGTPLSYANATGFRGVSRSLSTAYNVRISGSTTAKTQTSQTPANSTITVFSWPSGSYTNARMSFYSIGESLDLALLDARITTYMASIQ